MLIWTWVESRKELRDAISAAKERGEAEKAKQVSDLLKKYGVE
jgi:hypothetical protein